MERERVGERGGVGAAAMNAILSGIPGRKFFFFLRERFFYPTSLCWGHEALFSQRSREGLSMLTPANTFSGTGFLEFVWDTFFAAVGGSSGGTRRGGAWWIKHRSDCPLARGECTRHYVQHSKHTVKC